jgi:hypothetical protein
MERGEIAQAAVAVIIIVALVIGRPVSMPDNVQNLHGFPMVWGTHQLVTIAGPVDTWRVSITALIIDLVLWLAILIMTPVAVEYYFQRGKKTSS